jgi:hypothetical protein
MPWLPKQNDQRISEADDVVKLGVLITPLPCHDVERFA